MFKQKTAYEMRISDWSADVCASDLRSSSCTSKPPPHSNPPPGAQNPSSLGNRSNAVRCQRHSFNNMPGQSKGDRAATRGTGGDGGNFRDGLKPFKNRAFLLGKCPSVNAFSSQIGRAHV